MIYQKAKFFSSYPKISFGVLIIFYGYLGYLIVTQYLMEKQIRSFLSKTIFTITFMCSLSLLTMYLYQISLIDLSDQLWDFILLLLVLMCTIVIPISLLFRVPFITVGFTICKGIKIPFLLIVIVLFYLRVLTYWSLEIKDKKQIYYDYQIVIFSKNHINILVQIMVNYGVYITAFMSAYGAVWCPYVYYNYVNTQEKKLKEEKQKLKQKVHFIIEQIKNAKYQLLLLLERQKQLEVKLNESLRQKQQKKINSYSRFLQFFWIFSQDPIKQELKQVLKKAQRYKNQLDTLQNSHYSQLQDYRKIVQEEKKHQIKQTYMGKLFKLFSNILFVYSLGKIILTAWNMIKGRKLSTDPITRALIFIAWGRGQQANDYFKTLSQYISFGYMGYLLISNVRSFSMNVKNFFDFIIRRNRLEMLSTDTIVLLLSEMYGIYFLSAVILLQSSLPRTYVTNFQHITGQVRLVEHFTLFDKLFFWSCIAIAILVGISFFKSSTNKMRLLKKQSKQQQYTKKQKIWQIKQHFK